MGIAFTQVTRSNKLWKTVSKTTGYNLVSCCLSLVSL